ncbi:hypothetical protein D9M72_554750 [compost metagenome]
MSARANRLQLELRIESGDFQNADQRHVEHVCYMFNGSFRNPAILLLCTHEQRNDSRLLAAIGEFCDRLVRPVLVFRIKSETSRLDGIICETANGHQRSTSPNTISSEPRIADTSANM